MDILESKTSPTEVRRASLFLEEALNDIPHPAATGLTEIIAMEEICPGGDVYRPGRLPYLLLFLTFQGRSHAEFDGQPFLHEPGALIVADGDCSMIERIEPGHDWHLCYLMLRGAWAVQMSAYLNQRPGASVIAFPNAPLRQRQLFTEIFDLAFTQPNGYPWLVLSRAAELLGTLFTAIQTAMPGTGMILEVGRLLDADPEARPTVAQIAAHLGITQRQLVYQFQKAAGEPLALWIRKRRIGAARRLLGQGLSVTEVAERLGFPNPYNFSRLFKTVTGFSPSTITINARRTGLHVREDG